MPDHHVEIIGNGGGWYSEWFACCHECDWRGPLRWTKRESCEDASPHDDLAPDYPRQSVHTNLRPFSDLHRESNERIWGALAWEEARMQERLREATGRL